MPSATSNSAVPSLDRLIALALSVAGLLVVTCVTSQIREGRWAVAGDAHYVYATARSLAYDGDLDLANQLGVMGDRYGFASRAADDGFVAPPREVGPALVMVPGLWLAHAVRAPARLEPTFAATLPSLSVGLAYWLTLLAIAHLVPRAGARSRRCAALVAVLGGTLPFYAVASAGYPHATDAVVCSALAWALARDPELHRPVALGVVLALATLVRLQNALWLCWPVVALIMDARRLTPSSRRRRARGIALAAALGSLGAAPLFLVDLAHPGSPGGAIRWSLEFFDAAGLASGAAAVLWGVHGVWSWTPLMLVGSVGLVSARNLAPALAVLLAMLVLMSLVADPDGGSAYGARRLSGLTPLFGIGLAALARRAHRAWGQIPHGFRIAIAACVVSNLYRTAAAMVGLLRLS